MEAEEEEGLRLWIVVAVVPLPRPVVEFDRRARIRAVHEFHLGMTNIVVMFN